MKKIACLIIMVFLFMGLYAQDPHFSQYYAAPLYLNPAFTGTSPVNKIHLNHRLQWPVLPQAYNTYALGIDFSMPELKSGFGILATTDKAGTAGLRSTTAGFIYSYNMQMENKWVLSPAVYFGYGSRSIGYNQLIFGDQLEFGNSSAPTSDPSVAEMENVSYFDSGAGLLFYSQKTWIGTSFWHINQPNISFMSHEDRVPMKMTIHAGRTFRLNKGWWRVDHPSFLSASLIYNWQGPFHQMDLGMNYHLDPIIIGLWFRGIPLRKNVIGNYSRDALVFSSGLRFDKISFQYSYDFTVSELGVRSQGAHEISLEYQFLTPVNPKRVPRSKKFLPCPSYIPYEAYKPNRRK